jgi:hypothetical protein
MMKTKIATIALGLAACLSTPITAQTTAAPAMAPVASAFSIDSPIEQLVANPATKIVLDTDFPGLTAHPAYEQFKAMSLKQLQPFSNGVITDDLLVKAGTDLAAIK